MVAASARKRAVALVPETLCQRERSDQKDRHRGSGTKASDRTVAIPDRRPPPCGGSAEVGGDLTASRQRRHEAELVASARNQRPGPRSETVGQTGRFAKGFPPSPPGEHSIG